MSTAARVALGDGLDPLRSPLLDAELPGLRTALDGDAIRGHLEAVLHPRPAIACSTPGQATYLGDCCVVRYRLDLEGDPPSAVLVTGRLFADREACARYVEERLAPLAESVRGREELDPFTTPVGIVEPLRMAVQVFPVDGELPTLVDATDRRRMLGVLGGALPATGEDGLAVEDCQVELGHYGRQHRCVLRYHVDARTAGDGGRRRVLVYGKVAGDGRGALAEPVTGALRRLLAEQDGYRFGVPRCYGFLPDLQLALFEAIPGVPRVAQLLKARIQDGTSRGTPGGLTLEESVESCARIAATLHTSRIGLGRARTFGDEAAGLRSGFSLVRRVSPRLGERLDAWLDLAEERAAASGPLPPGFAHGDFSYTQLIFDGRRSGLVDFDTVCQAEPALDLGQFLAYLAVAARKARTPDGPGPGASLAGQLGARFLDAYAEAAGADRAELLDRAAVYEMVSLLRLAFHSWQKLKRSRLEHVVDVLDERVPELAARG
ncbi:MAG TPA: phosphotransferase [Actinomycetes bacterium]|jgi:hypothetical protein|nr:phosphotransferase [Actinomycetes bacterium]